MKQDHSGLPLLWQMGTVLQDQGIDEAIAIRVILSPGDPCRTNCYQKDGNKTGMRVTNVPKLVPAKVDSKIL